MEERERKSETGSRKPVSGGFSAGRPRAWGPGAPPPPIKDAKGILKRLWTELLSRHKKKMAMVFAFTVLSSALGLTGPFLIGMAINAFVQNEPFYRIVNISVYMIIAYSLGAILSWLQNYIMAGVSQRAVTDLRCQLFSKLHTLSIKFFDQRPHGELMSRLTNDIDNISNSIGNTVVQVFASVITVLGALGMMLWLNPQLTVLGLIFIPVGFFVTGKVAGYTRKYFMEGQKDLGALNGYIEEIILAQRVVKAFAHEEKSILHFDGLNVRLKNANMRAQIFAGVIPPIMNLLNNLSLVMIAAAGGWMVLGGTATLGMIASFLNYSRQFSWPINELANQFNMIQSALAGAERVYEIMDQKPEIVDEVDAIYLGAVSDAIVFDNVTFGYVQDTNVLEDINMVAKAGQIIALVGPTGAGKTTIANLLTRFYDVDQGRICIDGKDIKTVRNDSLCGLIGLVLQDTYLFSESVYDNIRYGRLDATDAEVEQAARMANADNFIRRLPDGYNTVLSEGGENLSHGQRQLLAIARAILTDPDVLVLDEATSNIDTRTEMYIRQAMKQLMKGRTSFVIAHRLSTIRNADQIVVINGGRIIERGSHEKLLEERGFYYNLYFSQFRMHARQNTLAV